MGPMRVLVFCCRYAELRVVERFALHLGDRARRLVFSARTAAVHTRLESGHQISSDASRFYN